MFAKNIKNHLVYSRARKMHAEMCIGYGHVNECYVERDPCHHECRLQLSVPPPPMPAIYICRQRTHAHCSAQKRSVTLVLEIVTFLSINSCMSTVQCARVLHLCSGASPRSGSGASLPGLARPTAAGYLRTTYHPADRRAATAAASGKPAPAQHEQ